jgi:hypothetical protein
VSRSEILAGIQGRLRDHALELTSVNLLSISPAAIWGTTWKYVVGFASFPIIGRLAAPLLQDLRKRLELKRAADRIVLTQLDPLLKSADELQGKLRSLADEDFREFRAAGATPDVSQTVNLCSTLYLFAQFWGRLEILRRESFHAELTKNYRGRQLMDFLRCLESKHVRLVDRAWQRAMGELVFSDVRPLSDIMTFREFVERYETNERLRIWVHPLEELLRDTRFRRARQRVLQYGVIVHSLIDTLDPHHKTTRERPAYPNKLTRRAKRELIGRVFGVYLTDVKGIQKYTGIRTSRRN